MRLILLGAPGAGKGTQAEILSRKLGVPSISTGNILRAAMKNGTPVGLKAKAYVDSGRLVPDEVIIGIIKERLQEDDCQNGYILDGMPRTIAQAEALEQENFGIDTVLNMDTPDDVIMSRLTGRRMCCNCGASFHLIHNPPKQEGICDFCGSELIVRKDDSPETVKARLEIYHSQTKPLVGFYRDRGKLVVVESHGDVDETSQAVLKALGI